MNWWKRKQDDELCVKMRCVHCGRMVDLTQKEFYCCKKNRDVCALAAIAFAGGATDELIDKLPESERGAILRLLVFAGANKM